MVWCTGVGPWLSALVCCAGDPVKAVSVELTPRSDGVK